MQTKQNNGSNITQLPIFSEYFYNYVNSCSEYSITKEFMKDNIFIEDICHCGSMECATVYLSIKKELPTSNGVIENSMFNNKMIHLHAYAKSLEFEALGEVYPYKDEILNLIII